MEVIWETPFVGFYFDIPFTFQPRIAIFLNNLALSLGAWLEFYLIPFLILQDFNRILDFHRP